MTEILLGFLQMNENVNYSFIIPAIILYILFFWIIVSLWVYYDAKKRFQNKRTALIVAAGNIFFMLPFLLLYLLFRPIDEDYVGETQQGGLNVPIINFIGEDGVAMTLELKINNHKIIPENSSEMKIDVSFDSKDDNKKILDGINTIIENENGLIPVKTNETKKSNGLFGIISKVKSGFIKAKSEDIVEKEVINKAENTKENIGINTFQVKNKKNKKRRH